LTAAPKVLWRPNPGPQTRFLSCAANEVLYGGAAGGGKSAASIAMPLRWIENGNYRGLFLRREAKYLSDALDKSTALYPHFGAKLVQSPKLIWTFPSGAKIWLNHCEHESDVANYDSLEFHEVIFEELTHFTEKQYRGIRARIRGTDRTLPRNTRSTTNPGGPGHEWVFKRFGNWLDPKHERFAQDGEVRYFRGDEEVSRGTEDSLSRTFIGAKLADNPHVTSEYRAQLLDLDPVRRAQLLSGDWLAKPAAGMYFKSTWFGRAESLPKVQIRWCRYWDRAATVDGDWTVGLLLGRCADGVWIVADVVRLRGTPAVVQRAILSTAQKDGSRVAQVLEQDPAQAGIVERDMYARLLQGHNVRFVKPIGSKPERATGASAQAEAGKVFILCEGGRPPAWRDAFIGEVEAFEDDEKKYDFDDQVDAFSGAFNYLVGKGMLSDGHSFQAMGEDRRDMGGFV